MICTRTIQLIATSDARKWIIIYIRDFRNLVPTHLSTRTEEIYRYLSNINNAFYSLLFGSFLIGTCLSKNNTSSWTPIKFSTGKWVNRVFCSQNGKKNNRWKPERTLSVQKSKSQTKFISSELLRINVCKLI